MEMKPRFYYAGCYDKMAANGLKNASHGVCIGKIKRDGEIYIYADCLKCPYWIYSGVKPEAGYGRL